MECPHTIVVGVVTYGSSERNQDGFDFLSRDLINQRFLVFYASLLGVERCQSPMHN